jgi:tetratricopeptide (TPR) repeat protein
MSNISESRPTQLLGSPAVGCSEVCGCFRRIARILLMLVVTSNTVFGFAVGKPSSFRREAVTKLVVQIQRADYEGDRAALKRLYQDLSVFADDKKLGESVRYWCGFALWRRALNGFNESVDRSELEQDLRQAVSEFDAAVAKDPAFVDAKIADGSCLLMLVFLYQKDTARLREFLVKASPLLKEAETAEPENPRLLWVLGGSSWAAPLEFGGSKEKAFELYEKGLRAARARKGVSSDPLTPSWGEPELLMSLAWSSLSRAPPDLIEAEQYAQQALKIVPYWHYVRDILLTQIAAAKQKAGDHVLRNFRRVASLAMKSDPAGGGVLEGYPTE